MKSEPFERFRLVLPRQRRTTIGEATAVTVRYFAATAAPIAANAAANQLQQAVNERSRRLLAKICVQNTESRTTMLVREQNSAVRGGVSFHDLRRSGVQVTDEIPAGANWLSSGRGVPSLADDATNGAACATGQVCSQGACQLSCQGGLVNCDGTCVDPTSSRAYCGATTCADDATNGVACAAGQVCSQGTCQLSCQGGLVNCDGTCVDPTSSRAYCGATTCADDATNGAACATGQVCSQGACQLSCQGGLVNCDGTCIDPTSSRAYCGATTCADDATNGVACATGQVCSQGTCQLSCQGGLVNCGGTCIDPTSNRAYCGATTCADDATNGEVCATGQVCSLGTCQLSCQSGLVNCDGTCIDPTSSRAYCGATICADDTTNGEVCAAGQVCNSGTCKASCGGSLAECSGVCRDLSTDERNCGVCGTTCGAAQYCTSGVCCAVGKVGCGGVCVDLARDKNNCSACGNVCGVAAPYCAAGHCTAAPGITWAQLLASSATITAIPAGYSNTHDGGATIDPGRHTIWAHYGTEGNYGNVLWAIDYVANTKTYYALPFGTHGSYPEFDGGSYVYVFEDTDAGGARNRFGRMDVTTRTFTELAAAPLAHDRYTSGAYVGGRFWKLGASNVLMSYNPSTDSWTSNIATLTTRARLLSNPFNAEVIWMLLEGGHGERVHDRREHLHAARSQARRVQLGGELPSVLCPIGE